MKLTKNSNPPKSKNLGKKAIDTHVDQGKNHSPKIQIIIVNPSNDGLRSNSLLRKKYKTQFTYDVSMIFL